jgi:F-type H+-transporting ATPase subunit b
MLDISPIVMLIEAGIFFVTLILLNQWLFQPLLSHMDKRDAKLKAELNSVSNNADEAKKYEEEITSIIENAKSEANKIKKEATDIAKKEAAEMVEAALKKIDDSKVAFNDELEVKKAELLNVLESEAGELKSMLSEKLKGIA